ncbi:MAG: PTS ascorbate transporter subunit IIC [Faecalimonas sp.]|nr:PTS ascorbate transporter subunit IIC [Faecalimonas sp.]
MADVKKQVPLRLSPKLYNALAAWAEDDFRSLNGQIEFLLTECVKQHRSDGKYISMELHVRPKIELQHTEHNGKGEEETR